MNHKKSEARISYLVFLLIAYLLSLISAVHGAEWGKFQMIVPTPDPIKAGDKLICQVIAVNNSTQDQSWLAGEYTFEIEVYDENKNYLIKSGKIKGDEDVGAGGSTLVFLPFNVPNSFSGTYSFKIGLTYKSEKIAYSDFIPFHVEPVSSVNLQPSAFKIGGNAIMAYRNGSSANWGNYVGNTSINLMGSINSKAFVSNIYTNHKPDNSFELYNLLINYYGGNWDLAIGDVMPVFSVLSLNNLGMRGIYPTVRASRFETSAIVARTEEAREGSSTTSGVFARYLYGVQEKITMPFESSVGVSYVSTYDDSNSIRGQGLIPLPYAKNNVFAINAAVSGLQFLTMDFDFANSLYSTSTITDAGSTGQVSDSAYSTNLNFKTGEFRSKIGYQFVGSNFSSLGSPTIVQDRVTNDFNSSYGIPNLMNFSLAYIQYNDNLKKAQSKNTTTQKIYSFNTGLVMPNVPTVNIGYSKNDILGKAFDETEAIKNYTNVVSISVSKPFKRVILNVSGQKNDFTDEISTETDNNSLSASIGSTFLVNEKISFSLSAANSKVDLIRVSTQASTNNISLTVNYKIIPDRIVLALWGTFSEINRSAKDNGVNFSNILATTSNIEATYYVNQQLAFTLGAGADQTKDKFNTANSTSQTRFSTRLSLGF